MKGVYCQGIKIGELTTYQEGLYTWFSITCCPPERGIWCAWAVGEQGEPLRLGVVEPMGGQFTISRRFPTKGLASMGKLIRGELRRVEPHTEDWTPLRQPEQIFRWPWLCRELRQYPMAWIRQSGRCRCVAIPYDGTHPFPLVRLFCFARLDTVCGRQCVCFAFDETDRPAF